MKKSIALSTAALLSCSLLQAAEIQADGKDAGNVDLMFKAMHILNDKNNNWAPNSGSGYLVKLKYDTPDILTDGLKVGVGMYVNGDTGATAWDSPGKYKPARGMFVAARGDSKAIMGEAYVSYKGDNFHAKAGRQVLKTPLTVIKTSLMPNFYEAYVLGTKAAGFSVTAAHVTKMSFGSRAVTDWSLIGEKTGTAGVLTDPREEGTGGLSQAKFYNMGNAALGTDETTGEKSTDGITALGVSYKGVKNLDVNLWMYHAYDIANDYYADVNYAIPVTDGMKVKLSAQYLAQRDTGKELAGSNSFDMYGLKASLGTKKWGAYAAFNQSSDNDNNVGFVNPWGSDPGYTSSIFSRNEYRDNVSAYKVGAHYKIMKGLKFMASHADYGQSDTGNAVEDATETDLVLAYKPTKAWMFKIFNAIRTSEYNGNGGVERKQNHVRAVASYTF
jgi:hypothetical protein